MSNRIAILDTRDLATKQPTQAISTFQYVTGSDIYCLTASQKFLFGTSTKIERKNILATINSLLPHSRNIVLVGHGIAGDLRTLEALGFDFQRVSVILDTGVIANDAYARGIVNDRDLWVGFDKLGDLLIDLGCPVGNLHVAGNDAYFTMRLLLLSALKDHDHSADTQPTEILRNIAHTPTPSDQYPYRITPQDDESRAERKKAQEARNRQCAKVKDAKRRRALKKALENEKRREDVEYRAKIREERGWNRSFRKDVENTGKAVDWLLTDGTKWDTKAAAVAAYSPEDLRSSILMVD